MKKVTLLFGKVTFSSLCLIQIRQRIHLTAIDNNLKVHMRSRTSSRITAQGDLLTLRYLLA